MPPPSAHSIQKSVSPRGNGTLDSSTHSEAGVTKIEEQEDNPESLRRQLAEERRARQLLELEIEEARIVA
jgi:hypothetical protein